MKKLLISFLLVTGSSFIYAAEKTAIKKFEPSYLRDNRFALATEVKDVGTIHTAYNGAIVVARVYGSIGKTVIADVAMNSDNNIFAIGQCATTIGGEQQIKYVNKYLLRDLNPPWTIDNIIRYFRCDGPSAALEHVVENSREKMVRVYTSKFEKMRESCMTESPGEIATQLTRMTKQKVAASVFSFLIENRGYQCPLVASIQTMEDHSDLLMGPFLEPKTKKIRFGLNTVNMSLDKSILASIDGWSSEKKLTEIAEILLYHHRENIKGDQGYNRESRPLMTLIDFSALSKILAQKQKVIKTENLLTHGFISIILGSVDFSI